MEITTIDNREAYKAREEALRHEQPYKLFDAQTVTYTQRVSRGLKFQHNLRVEREVKRRMSLKPIS